MSLALPKFGSLESSKLDDFVRRRQLEDALPTASSLAAQHFQLVGVPTLQLMCDPESGEEWIDVMVTVRGEIETILADYDGYVSEWLSRVPREKGALIRLQIDPD